MDLSIKHSAVGESVLEDISPPEQKSADRSIDVKWIVAGLI